MYENIGVNIQKKQSDLIKKIKIPKISKNSISYKATSCPDSKFNYNDKPILETASGLGKKPSFNPSITFPIMDKKVKINKKTLALAGIGTLASIIGLSLLTVKLKK